MNRKLFLTAAAVCGALSGCVGVARIAAPVTASPAIERLELRGMGAGTKGDFRIGGSRGAFVRSAGAASVFGMAEKRGGGRFDLMGPIIEREVSGHCWFDEDEVKLGKGVAVTTNPLLYSCDFERGGRPAVGKLLLSASDDSLGSMFRHERKGVLDYQGRKIDIRSIHTFEGGKMPTMTPLGYSFEENGVQIGAIDLNGLNKTLFVPRDPARREAVLAASLALSILWDPAASD